MLVIGEKLNSAIPSVRRIINDRDGKGVKELALKQTEAGADFLDLNTAQCDKEPDDMEWLVHTVQEATDTPLCVDSTEAPVIKRGMDAIDGDKSRHMVNSISMEKNRIEGVLPLVMDYKCWVIGLTTDDVGIPKTAEERLDITGRMVALLTEKNFDMNKLYIDPLVLPIAVSHTNANMFFECLSEIKRSYGVKTVSGLSNISFGMPNRKSINRQFLTVCMAKGMDAAILDPLDLKIMTALITTDMLLGNDRYSMKYLSAYRKGLAK